MEKEQKKIKTPQLNYRRKEKEDTKETNYETPPNGPKPHGR